MALKLVTDPINPPSVSVPEPNEAPVRTIKSEDLKQIGAKLDRLFMQYVSDRRIAELKWLRNLRQYLGVYDPEVDKELAPNRSRAYPRITRVKCVSTLSRLMNLMFPGNERNWEVKASPSPDLHPDEVAEAIQTQQKLDQAAGVQSEVDEDYITMAVKHYADAQAQKIEVVIDDQMQELGGEQTLDYIALNRAVIKSGITYGVGVLRGPYAREVKSTIWTLDKATRKPQPRSKTVYKPMYEFLPVWDFYPDLSAKTFASMDGYFTRTVMSRAQVKALSKREDFFKEVIDDYLTKTPTGNYRPQPFETELRAMGVKINVNEVKAETMKYEVLTWHGPVSGHLLSLAGVDVPEDKLADDMDAEVWMIAGNVIKADINPWVKVEAENVNNIHVFLFDEDDTSPVGNGLPNIIRDSQMSISASSRMLLDNASVVCGPNLELNTALLRPDQDLASISAYRNWYRDDDGPTSQYPAVRNVSVDAHLDELMKVIDLFMKFADAETFVNPATGGDMSRGPSEPFRTAAGASMLRGDAALPFKDIVRNFDTFTQSVVQSMLMFNRKFNPTMTPKGDYNVIARGATSLISKEIRGIQVDNFAQTARPEEMVHVDERKLVEARLSVRDMTGMLVTENEAARRAAAKAQQASEQADMMKEQAEAMVRKTLAEAFKNITQGQKNLNAAQVDTVNAALQVLEKGLQPEQEQQLQQQPQQATPAAPQPGMMG